MEITVKILFGLFLFLCSCNEGPSKHSSIPTTLENGDRSLEAFDTPFEIDTIIDAQRIKIYFDEKFLPAIKNVDSSAIRSQKISSIPLVVEVNGCKAAIGLHSGYYSHNSGIYFRNDEGEILFTQFFSVSEGRYIFVLEYEIFSGIVAFDIVDGCPRLLRKCTGTNGDGFVLFTDTGDFIYEKSQGLLVAPNIRKENDGQLEKVAFSDNCFEWELKWKTNSPKTFGRDKDPKLYEEILMQLEKDPN